MDAAAISLMAVSFGPKYLGVRPILPSWSSKVVAS